MNRITRNLTNYSKQVIGHASLYKMGGNAHHMIQPFNSAQHIDTNMIRYKYKMKSVQAIRKRFKVSGSGKLMRRRAGKRHNAKSMKSRRYQAQNYSSWVEVTAKGYAKKYKRFMGKTNYI
mmetsp:Transcript_1105/g.1707  ORF Transcript_1105/g.1707 Transcript_1105/m.1707 type:complete len:120 (+) Transcript_1105:41-400(+)